TGRNKQAEISDLQPDDIVIVPAFGTELSMLKQIKERGCQIVDNTCGDVMSVWKRVRKYASEAVTSIIHGKAEHEETKATSSRTLPPRTFVSSIRSAARPRNVRMRCANYSTSKWICSLLLAVTTARTLRTSRKWARKNCRPILS